MTKRALYPGSFDPITFGHLDIIKRSLCMFDEVIIAIFDNPSKHPIFTFEERKKLIEDVIDPSLNVAIDSFNGLLAEYAKTHMIQTVIRGLRAVSDFDYEFQMALTNRKLGEQLDTIFFMTDEKYSYLSSSLVKQVCQFDGDISLFVPIEVEKALKEKFS